jgi:hypothetical protein
VAFTEDLTAFFLTADFATAATYKAGGTGPGTTVNVIFDNPDKTAFGMSGTNPNLLVKASDITSFSNADTFTIGSTVYRAIDSEPLDDGAVLRIQLESSSGARPEGHPRRGEDGADEPHAEQRDDPAVRQPLRRPAAAGCRAAGVPDSPAQRGRQIETLGVNRIYERRAELVVEGCQKKNATFEDDALEMIRLAEVALTSLTGAKAVDISKIEIEDDATGEKPRIVARMTFSVLYYTAIGSPDTAL